MTYVPGVVQESHVSIREGSKENVGKSQNVLALFLLWLL